MDRFELVLIQKNIFDGLTEKEIRFLFSLLNEKEGFPIEFLAKERECSAMGFITPAAAEKLDYDYKGSGLETYIAWILDNILCESADGRYTFKGISIWMGYGSDVDFIQDKEIYTLHEINIAGRKLFLYSNNCFTAMQSAYAYFVEEHDSFIEFMKMVVEIKETEKVPEDKETFWGTLGEFEEMKAYRKMPFLYIGQKVIYHGINSKLEGTIVGIQGSFCLAVLFQCMDYVSKCHPEYALTYYGKDGSIVAEYDR